MGNQVLASTVIKILADSTIPKVKFVLNGLTVSGVGYKLVSDALAKGKMDCDVGVTPNPNLPAGFAAVCRYEPDHRSMRFSNQNYGLSPGTQTFDIVHEATHALFDCIYGKPAGTQIPAFDDEAAAFLAQAIYSRASPYMWGGPIPQGDPIYEALMLADKIMAIPRSLAAGSPPYVVTPGDLMTLRQSIQTAYKFVGGAAGIQHVYYGIPP